MKVSGTADGAHAHGFCRTVLRRVSLARRGASSLAKASSIGAVDRQTEQFGAVSLDCLSNAGYVVRTEAIHDDVVGLLQCLPQHLPDMGQEHLAIVRPLEDAGGQ